MDVGDWETAMMVGAEGGGAGEWKDVDPCEVSC